MPVIICAPFIGNTTASLDFTSGGVLPVARASSLSNSSFFSPTFNQLARPGVLTSQYTSTFAPGYAEEQSAKASANRTYQTAIGDYKVQTMARPATINNVTFASAALQLPAARASRK